MWAASCNCSLSIAVALRRTLVKHCCGAFGAPPDAGDQVNSVAVAAANARHHYDLSTELYRLFLDDGLNYSCAIFERPATDTLEQAQHRKLQNATAKLRLLPGMTVAKLGSGWGAFAIHIAATTGARVTAINVSPRTQLVRLHRPLHPEAR